jgi:large subunit ribosomal protein L18
VSVATKIDKRAQRRALRTRSHIQNKQGLPRVSVFRSLKHIYAQVIDDKAQKTLVSCSSVEVEGLTGDKKQIAHSVGKTLADRAMKLGISAVIFDRGSYLYHGRVKELADGLREGGIKV